MSRLGFKPVVVYDGEACLGELEIVQTNEDNKFQFPNNEIRIHHFSQRSERCLPISVLQTIAPFNVRCKLKSPTPVEQPPLINLHSSCFHDFKTAVVLSGEGEEIHLVAMLSKEKQYPRFWCYSVPCGLYDSCLGMLNMRCLSIVFDLDETLIVANTMKSFDDRIEAIRNWMMREPDPNRISGMSAEAKRYTDDRMILKQYIDTDSVVDNGKVYKVQGEEVFRVEGQDPVIRPVIRLPEKNIVLTRINPEIRDTSVLVRLRPAWEDLRSYLIAKGRKRFEVYVCTMAERDYALEMWRLLDPEAHLINSKQLSNRIVCVKSGAKKSLMNVFQDGNCHPKMAMVIDDRLKVWEDKDQPRVHVVPAFTPYYAPQAETTNAVPVLCVARNVACNVRGGFFKEFDENLLRRVSDLFYEDEVSSLPSPPDVSNYLMSEDASFIPNNSNAPIAEGMNGPEAAQRMNQSNEKASVNSAIHPMTSIPEMRSDMAQQTAAVATNGLAPPASLRPSEKPSLLGAPFKRDTSFSESDPDSKRRALSMNQSQDLRYRGTGDPHLLSRLPGQHPGAALQPQGGWLVEEDINRGRVSNQPSASVQGSDLFRPERQRPRQNSLGPGTLGSVSVGVPSHVMAVKGEEACHGHDLQKQNPPLMTQQSDIGSHPSINSREVLTDGGKTNLLQPSLYIGVLQEIGQRCSSKVEFRSVVSTSESLQFSVEVLFTGEKIGFGTGKTRKDAQQHAAENALRNLADKYVAYVSPRSGAVDGDIEKLSLGNEIGFLWDTMDPESNQLVNTSLSKESTSEVAETKCGASSCDVVNGQHGQKRASSPRSLQSQPSKRLREDLHRASHDMPSLRHPKKGQAIA